MSTPETDHGQPATYVLGHSDRELERLTTQARLVDPITRHFFVQAGITSGMRVLDVGSGPGDVAFLAAELVGEDRRDRRCGPGGGRSRDRAGPC